MNIKQIQDFRLFDRRKDELCIVEFRRSFADNSFQMEKRTQSGKVIQGETVSEEFAKTVLEQALICLPKSDLEITKFSTGVKFNYPVAQI